MKHKNINIQIISRHLHSHAYRLLIKLILITLCICHISPTYSQVVIDDFETGTINSKHWGSSIGARGSAKTTNSITTSPVCNGTYSLKSFVSYPGFRSELGYINRQFRQLKNGHEYWIGIAVYLADGWQQDGKKGEVLFQAHHVPDKNLGEPGGNNPPFLLRTRQGQWEIQAKTEFGKICGECDKTVLAKRIGAYKANAWTEFVFNVKFTHTNSGFLKAWKDNKLVVNYSGPIGYNDEVGPFLKMGVYKSSWIANEPSGVKSRKAFHDSFRIKQGAGSKSEVAPNCGNGKHNALIPPPTKLKIIQN